MAASSKYLQLSSSVLMEFQYADQSNLSSHQRLTSNTNIWKMSNGHTGVDYIMNLMTDPPLLLDMVKEEKKLRSITKSYGEEYSKDFSQEVLLGMLDGDRYILLNEELIVKKLKEKLNEFPTIDLIDTYINYYYKSTVMDLLVKKYGLNTENTHEDLFAIIESEDFNASNESTFSEVYSLIQNFITDESIQDALFTSLQWVTIRDVQENPEGFSTTFKVLKTLILLNNKHENYDNQKAADTLIWQIAFLGKLDTVLEYHDGDEYLNEYLQISDEEIDNFKVNIYSTVVELGVPIIQTVFVERYGMIEVLNATYMIMESKDKKTFAVQKIMIAHDASIPFINNINTKINLLNKSLSKNLDSTDLQKQVYSALISPILNLNLLNHNGEDLMPIIFITNATTQSIPFTALIDENDNYLLDSFVFIRSNSLLKLMNAKKETLWKKEKPLLIAGNIDYKNNKEYSTKRINDYGELDNLKWSRNELDMINEIETNSIIKSNISETDFKNIDFKMYGALHFSVHGKSIFENPGKSALFLGSDIENDGILTVNEIRQLDLSKIDFVFLSACETNTGKRYSNLNPVTLQTAFHQAGVNSTISTLWSIDDKATTYFSEIFYLMSEKTEFRFLALHRAKQLFIIKYPEYKDPYYWAAFTLDGF